MTGGGGSNEITVEPRYNEVPRYPKKVVRYSGVI